MDREYITEQLDLLSEYYSEAVGTNIRTGVEPDGDVWVMCNRTTGREYFESVSDLEDRVKLLYDEYFIDDDYSDPLDGWI